MPDAIDARMMQRLVALAQDATFNEQMWVLARQNGITELPPGYGSAAELALDYFARTNPAAIGKMLQEHERVHGPLPEQAPAQPQPQPQPQQQRQPQPQQQQPPQPTPPPQSTLNAKDRARFEALFAPKKIEAEVKRLKGSSAERQFLTPGFEKAAAKALRARGAPIPAGTTAGQVLLAHYSLAKDSSPADIQLITQETRGAFGDATELRRAFSKLTTHHYADAVAAKVKKAEAHDSHRSVESEGKAKEPTIRDAVAKAYYEQKTRAVRNGEPPKTPRRVYSKEDLETQKLKDQFFPDRARPIVLEPAVAHEIASEARDVAETEAFVNNDTGGEAAEGG